MTVHVEPIQETNVVIVDLGGKLTKDDYGHFVPALERLIRERGKIRILMRMHDFRGWDMAAAWEDLKFDFRHARDLERIAMVGDRSWEKGMATFCKPFTRAKIRYFDITDDEAAMQWILEDAIPVVGDEEGSEMVCVYTLHDSNLAEIICNALRADGIPCFVGDELQGSLTGIFEVDIMVRACDADRARAFIKSHEGRHKPSI